MSGSKSNDLAVSAYDGSAPPQQGPSAPASTPALRIKFTIAQFTDLHYRNGEAEDRERHRLMNQVLDLEQPDLVVLTGDIIEGEYCRDPIRSMIDAVKSITDRKLPWAAVFGNHDDEGSADRLQLMAAMRKLPGCLALPGPEDLSGVGNYFFTVDPGFRLFFLDSHAYADHNRKEYAWIQQDQIDWFLQAPHDLPALVFFHIPLPEYDDAWSTGTCIGSKNEPVCCPKFNSGFFSALKSTGDVLGTFVGHDHTNDYIGELNGIRLCYGRCTGFSSYGKAGFPRGARIIQLTSGERKFQTHVLG